MKTWNTLASALLVLMAMPVSAQNTQPLNFLGTAELDIGPANIWTGPDDDLLTLNHGVRTPKLALANNSKSASSSVARLPTPRPQRVVNAVHSIQGFQGLTNYAQRVAGTGVYTNTQFSLEPPDQGLCVGNGFVMEAINNAIEVFDTRGDVVSGPTPLSQFYRLLPEETRTTPAVFGQFLSDPRCYYDTATERWFVTELEIDTDPTTGAFGNKSSALIAVSKTSNPVGQYLLYSIDTTDGNGSDPLHPGCPCFGDQPLIGADAFGFYVSSNEFSINAADFNGAQIYAVSKLKLEFGTTGTVVHIDAGAIPTPATDGGNLWYSVHPASSHGWEWNNQASEAGLGTEYFLSSLQFVTPFDNRIAVWALTGTASLNSKSPNVTLLHQVIGVESYGAVDAFGASQKPGPTPLRDLLAEGDTLNLLNANDDRMNQVAYVNGHLWSGVNTNVSVGGQTRQGIAWFEVLPTLHSGQVNGQVLNQGYVSVAGEDVLFPSIDVNQRGQAVMSFTLSGPDYYPSAAFSYIDQSAGDVHVIGAGVGPDDGFTGYLLFGGNGIARWGDYSAAAADEWGNIWVAAEYIGQRCTDKQFAADMTCGGTRDEFANWGTFIGRVPTGD
jgi:hypothetical protein